MGVGVACECVCVIRKGADVSVVGHVSVLVWCV